MDFTLKQITGRLAKALAAVHEGDFSKAKVEAQSATTALDALMRRDLASPADYQTRDMPIGYATPIGYVFDKAPKLADLITDLSTFVDVDEPILSELALKQGYAVCTVEAPPALRDRIKSCLAFPEVILREHYNV